MICAFIVELLIVKAFYMDGEGIDPAKKQYWIFSFILSLIFSILINFTAIEVMKNSAFYGVPIGLDNVSGVLEILARIVNSAFMALFIMPLVYYFLQWVQNRGGGGYY